MKIFFPVPLSGRQQARRLTRWSAVFVAGLCLLAARPVLGQAAEDANAGHGLLWVGGAVSGATLGYGNRRMLGATAFADLDSLRRFGFEGEARWLDFHQTANVHAETYLLGMRYHFNRGRYQPYVKALAGDGHFNFSYNFATGNYLVIAGGGGVDYRLNRRWNVRAEFEYQDWPQFTYGAMSSLGATVGLRYRVF
ncbi:MAG TPA: outer membrane beta-barrel protein [Terracidiphilus sp.]|jgi:opacity protein-like surface antigen|nr:outer membrane beta-barrel protein [Terracidiphilus sp.]